MKRLGDYVFECETCGGKDDLSSPYKTCECGKEEIK